MAGHSELDSSCSTAIRTLRTGQGRPPPRRVCPAAGDGASPCGPATRRLPKSDGRRGMPASLDDETF